MKLNEIVQEIETRTDIYQICSELLKLKKGNGTGSFYCPLHQDSKPSFIAKEGYFTYKCASNCGTGNIYQLISKVQNISYTEAVQKVCDFVGMDFKLEDKITEITNKIKPLSEDHIKYLNDVRGINSQTAKNFNLGSRGSLIAFPQVLKNVLVGYKFIDPKNKSKMFFEGTNNTSKFYPDNDFQDIEILIFTAGEWDCIKLTQELQNYSDKKIKVVSNSNGEGNIPYGLIENLSKAKSLEGIKIFYDNDPSGKEGALKLANALQTLGKPIHIFYYPEDKPKGYDIIDFFKEGYSIDNLFELPRDKFTINMNDKSEGDLYENERAILNFLILNNEFIIDATSWLNSNDFKDYRFSMMFSNIKFLNTSYKYCDYELLIRKTRDVSVKESIHEVKGSFGIGSYEEFKEIVETIKNESSKRELLKLKNLIDIEANRKDYNSKESFSKIAKQIQLSLLNSTLEEKGMTLAQSLTMFHNSYSDTETLRYISTPFAGVNETLNGGFRIGKLAVLGAKPSLGKEQPLDSDLITPTGIKKMGDSYIGMDIIGSNGKSYKITGVFPQGLKDVYKVSFDDGSYAECGLDHLWKVSGYSYPKRKDFVLTTKQLIEYGLKHRDKRFSIQLCKPVEFNPIKELKLNPYLLGLYLGDGSSDKNNNCSFHNTEKDLINRFNYLLSENDCLLIREKDHRIKRKIRNNSKPDFCNLISELGLNSKCSQDKFIPTEYLYGSIDDRILLLQGLNDSDGYVFNNHIEYCTSSKQLAEDIMFLAKSLGGKASCIEQKAFYTYKGEKKQGLNKFRIVMSFDKSIIPVSSEKHLKKYKNNKKFHYKTIVSIEKLGKKEMQCIMVNSPDHLYLTNGFTVTHNTTIAIQMAEHVASQGIKVAYYALETNEEELAEQVVSRRTGVSNYIIRKRMTTTDFNPIEDIPNIYQDTDENFWFIKANGMSAVDIINDIRVKVRKHGVKFAVIDLIQALRTGKGYVSRTEFLAELSIDLVDLPEQENIALLCLSHLKVPAQGQSSNKIPILDDLAGTAELGRRSYTCILMHGESKNDPNMKLLFRKNRNGEADTHQEVIFQRHISKFTEK